MQPMLSSLCAFAVAAHAVLGCCWHHGHERCGDVAPAKRVAPATCGCGTDHHADEGGRQASSEQRPVEDGCDGGQCSYVTSDARSAAEHSAEGAWLDESRDALPEVARLRIAAHVLIGDDPGRRVRLHLLHQMLVI